MFDKTGCNNAVTVAYSIIYRGILHVTPFRDTRLPEETLMLAQNSVLKHLDNDTTTLPSVGCCVPKLP